MTTKNERSHDIYIPMDTHNMPDGFRFLAPALLATLKDYDCASKRDGVDVYGNTTYSPKGDYIEIAPGLVVYACHLKSICTLADKAIITATITPGALILEWDNTHYTLKHQKVDPELVFVASLHNGDKTEDNIPAPDAWLVKACKKPGKNPDYRYQTIPWSNRSTDGFRLHLDTSIPDPSLLPPWDIDPVLNPCRKYDNISTLPVKATIQAIKQARAINKDIIRLSINGKLDIIARSEELGESTISIESGYSHTGDDATIAINPRFLLDALSGFTGEAILAIDHIHNPAKSAIYLTSGTREAVIMPMKMD